MMLPSSWLLIIVVTLGVVSIVGFPLGTFAVIVMVVPMMGCPVMFIFTAVRRSIMGLETRSVSIVAWGPTVVVVWGLMVCIWFPVWFWVH